MKKYDALYIFVNAVRDDAVEPLLEKVSGDITRLGGKVLGSEMLGRKNFARVMKKKESGVYVRVRFELDPSKVADLRARYALNDEIFRVQILAVDDRREALVVAQNARRQAAAEAAAAAAAEAGADEATSDEPSAE
jgi:ribosomal protein S6